MRRLVSLDEVMFEDRPTTGATPSAAAFGADAAFRTCPRSEGGGCDCGESADVHSSDGTAAAFRLGLLGILRKRRKTTGRAP